MNIYRGLKSPWTLQHHELFICTWYKYYKYGRRNCKTWCKSALSTSVFNINYNPLAFVLQIHTLESCLSKTY